MDGTQENEEYPLAKRFIRKSDFGLRRLLNKEKITPRGNRRSVSIRASVRVRGEESGLGACEGRGEEGEGG